MPSSPRILVVEDDSGIREIVRTRLRSVGYEVETARTGFEALSKIDTWHPSAVVLDINMPELDGFGVLEALGPKAGKTPILVLTARHAAEDVRRAIGLGAKDYLAKPLTPDALLTAIARATAFEPPQAMDYAHAV